MEVTTKLVVFVMVVIGVVAGGWWRVESAVKAAKTEVQGANESTKADIDKTSPLLRDGPTQH